MTLPTERTNLLATVRASLSAVPSLSDSAVDKVFRNLSTICRYKSSNPHEVSWKRGESFWGFESHILYILFNNAIVFDKYCRNIWSGRTQFANYRCVFATNLTENNWIIALTLLEYNWLTSDGHLLIRHWVKLSNLVVPSWLLRYCRCSWDVNMDCARLAAGLESRCKKLKIKRRNDLHC